MIFIQLKILRLIDYWVTLWQISTGSRTKRERELANDRNHDVKAYLKKTNHVRVLDLANGRLQPQFYQLQKDGYNVFGIDLVNNSQKFVISTLNRFAKWLYTRHGDLKVYYKETANLACGNVANLPYMDESFQLVTSVAAFEHFLDVPGVISEIHRVLCPGGVAWIHIHLFSSPSGAHNISLTEIPLTKIPQGFDPWDHLRERRLPITVPLNEWRLHQYFDAFSSKFTILNNYTLLREGEHFLTPEIENDLIDYTRNELTSGSFRIIVQKACETQ